MDFQIYGIQILGALFLAVMIYITFVNYKQNKMSKANFVFWTSIWVMVFGLLAYPKIIYGIMAKLEIYRTMDFFVVGGLMFFGMMVFYHNIIINKMKKQIETIVRDIAHYRAPKIDPDVEDKIGEDRI